MKLLLRKWQFPVTCFRIDYSPCSFLLTFWYCLTFSRNPHIPGQRLKVKVPKGISANETFKVTVPKPEVDEGDGDQNKFPRDLQDELDLYAREYDTYCKHEGEFRHAKVRIKSN